jgi:hypothetical protein
MHPDANESDTGLGLCAYIYIYIRIYMFSENRTVTTETDQDRYNGTNVTKRTNAVTTVNVGNVRRLITVVAMQWNFVETD